METMSPQDASFLHTEDAVTHMHISSVGIFDGSAPAPDEVPAAVPRQLPLVSRYRHKVRFVPLDLGRLIGAGDPHFSLGYHARRTALPSPAGGPELGNLVSRVMSQQLDHPEPLWEIWVAEGLDEGRWALLDRSREPKPPAADPWRPQPAPSPAEVVAHALALRAASRYEGMRGPRRPPRLGREPGARGRARLVEPTEARSGTAAELAERDPGANAEAQALGGGCRDWTAGRPRRVHLGDAAGARRTRRQPDSQRAVQTVTANVPAPRHPPYLCGRRMLEVFPFVPLGSSMRVGVAIFSYDVTINFGVTGDRESAPDVGVLCRGIKHGMAALRRAASPTPTPKRPARATPKPAGRGQRSRAVRPRVADMSSGERQDDANVAESSAAYVYAGLRANGDYYYSVTIPSLIVAAYGGGNAAAQRECLEMLGCYVAGKVRKFAGIIAAVVLCGVLSLGSAIVAEEWVQAHDLYGRDRP